MFLVEYVVDCVSNLLPFPQIRDINIGAAIAIITMKSPIPIINSVLLLMSFPKII